MRSATFELLTSALLASTVSVFAFGCDAPTPGPEQAQLAPTATPAPSPSDPPLEEVASPVATAASVPELDEQPVLASAATTSTTSTPSTTKKPRPSKYDLRDPSLLSPETPQLNAEAFAALPVGKRDQPPVAGAGASGIHLDELVVGRGWASSRCADLSDHFVPGVDDRISVCFRVVHPRAAEQVTVEWARDGELRQAIEVGVRETRTYRTRAWMPVTEGRTGAWTATVKSEDGAVLGQISFEIG